MIKKFSNIPDIIAVFVPAKFIYFLLQGSVMIDFECRNCGFKFRQEKKPLRCPYCSKEGSVGLLKTAQDLLDETLGE